VSKGATRKRKNFITFEDFKFAFDESIEASVKSRRIAGVLSLLRQQITFVFNGEQANQLLTAMRQLPAASALEFAVLLDYRLNPKASSTIGRLGADIIAQYVRETSFSRVFEQIGKDLNDLAAVHQWIQHSFETKDQEGSGVPRVTDRKVRSAFGCLLLLIEREEFPDMVLQLLELYSRRAARSARKKPIQKPSFSFAKIVGDLLAAPKPSLSQIKRLLNTTDSFRMELERQRKASREQTEAMESLETKLSATNDDLARSRELLVNMEGKTKDLAKEVRQLESRLREESARAIGIEQHWKQVVKQELAGFSFRLREQIEHEVNEIRLCIERENPNVEMAVHRLNRILSIIPGDASKS